MNIDEKRAKRNIEYARRWLNRAIKDFSVFRKLVPVDRKTNKPIRCSDPALAVYLLQQSIEKAVKAAAIASGQYGATDFRHYYSHNSLGLITNLYNRIIAQLQVMDLDTVAKQMGIDLLDGESKLKMLENQVMGKTHLLGKNGEDVDFRSASIRISPEVIDQIINMIMQIRSSTLAITRVAFSMLPKLRVQKGQAVVEDTEGFLKSLADSIATELQIRSPSEEQTKAAIDLVQQMIDSGFEPVGKLKRRDIITDNVGAWALSTALFFLSYLTFAHEGTSRYPLKRGGNIKTGKIGCDDYDATLGIVNRIGEIGYVTSLTLNDMRTEIDTLAIFFAVTGDH